MSEYKQVKIGKLKLKGTANVKHKTKKKRKHEDNNLKDNSLNIPEDDDAKNHGGWWSIETFEQLKGGIIAIQTYNNAYIFAVENGTLTLGNKHDDNDDGPEQEEMFIMVKISENKVALKSGYGK